MDNSVKKCPMCAEQIPLEATVCEYCGAQFDVEVRDGRVESRFIEEPLPQAVLVAETEPPPSPKRKVKFWILVPILLITIGAAGSLLWLGGRGLMAAREPTASATRAATRTPDHKATVQAQNTASAASAQWAWVDSFARPILDNVHGRKPNFEDDFEDRNGRFVRWSSISGNASFTEGVMRINTAGHDGVDAGGSLIATDFVLEYEFIPRVATDGSSAAVGFRWNNVGGYDLNFNLKDTWRGMISIPVEQTARIVAEGGSQETGLHRRTSVTIIAQGDRFAFYANGKPLFYAEDRVWSGDWIYISVWSPNGPSEVDFDNLKFWDLNDLLP